MLVFTKSIQGEYIMEEKKNFTRSGEQDPTGKTPSSSGATQFPDENSAPLNAFAVPLIISTLFCCMPVGAVGLFFSVQAKSLLQSGKYTEALNSAKLAKMFFWISFGIGFFLWSAYFIYLVVTFIINLIPNR